MTDPAIANLWYSKVRWFLAPHPSGSGWVLFDYGKNYMGTIHTIEELETLYAEWAAVFTKVRQTQKNAKPRKPAEPLTTIDLSDIDFDLDL